MSLQGDYDLDSNVTVSDATYILKWIAGNGPANYPNPIVNTD